MAPKPKKAVNFPNTLYVIFDVESGHPSGVVSDPDEVDLMDGEVVAIYKFHRPTK